jgi:hypothetical protein
MTWPGQTGTIPLPAIRTGDPHDQYPHLRPGGWRSLPELPPLPIGVLVIGTAELLQQAADLPQPRFISIYDGQAISLQFAKEQASLRAITRWALRFGSVLTSQPGQGTDGPETRYRTDFDYYGIAVTAYAHIPAAPAST